MNDLELFEKAIENTEKRVDEALKEKGDIDHRLNRISEAIIAISGDEKLALLLQVKLSAEESAYSDVIDQIERYKDTVRKISNEMLEVQQSNLHSREILEQLESVGADVNEGYDLIHRRQQYFDKCREQLLELSEKLEMNNPIPNMIFSVPFEKKNENLIKNEVDEAREILVAYMRDYNYTPDDWDTYINDPYCRMLIRKIDRNYKLPPMSPDEANKRIDAYMKCHNYDERDYHKYSQDPEWRYLKQALDPSEKLPPRITADNIGGWGDTPIDETISEALSEVNREYNSGYEWQSNCQRCVPAFELRLRGYEVKASPRFNIKDDHLAKHPEDAWVNPVPLICRVSDNKEYISKALENWGDGARVQIMIVDKIEGKDDNQTKYGHTFMAVRNNGKTMFLDPQTGDKCAEDYFDWAIPSETVFWRIDNLQPSAKALDCCL